MIRVAEVDITRKKLAFFAMVLEGVSINFYNNPVRTADYITESGRQSIPNTRLTTAGVFFSKNGRKKNLLQCNVERVAVKI